MCEIAALVEQISLPSVCFLLPNVLAKMYLVRWNLPHLTNVTFYSPSVHLTPNLTSYHLFCFCSHLPLMLWTQEDRITVRNLCSTYIYRLLISSYVRTYFGFYDLWKSLCHVKSKWNLRYRKGTFKFYPKVPEFIAHMPSLNLEFIYKHR